MAEQNVAGYSTPYRFTSKELDEETGLFYFGARYYDPNISIFHGVDAWAEKYPSWSPFTYTMNNPIRFIDPTGNGTEDLDGWIQRPDCIPFFSPEAVDEESTKRIFGNDHVYIGESAIMMNENVDQISLNVNGKATSSFILESVIVSNTKMFTFSSLATDVNTGVSGSVDATTGLFIGAGRVSQLSSEIAPLVKNLTDLNKNLGFVGIAFSFNEFYHKQTLGSFLNLATDIALNTIEMLPYVGAAVGVFDYYLTVSCKKEQFFNGIDRYMDENKIKYILEEKDALRLANYKYK